MAWVESTAAASSSSLIAWGWEAEGQANVPPGRMQIVQIITNSFGT